MKNKAKRIENTNNKFISRIKLWFQIEGRINNKTWKEYLENNRWLYQHKHNKLKHRSNMSNMEKHLRNKQIRQELYNVIRKDINENSKDTSAYEGNSKI